MAEADLGGISGWDGRGMKMDEIAGGHEMVGEWGKVGWDGKGGGRAI